MTNVYFIGKNHDNQIQDATGKIKLAPDRSGNVMVSPEKDIFLWTYPTKPWKLRWIIRQRFSLYLTASSYAHFLDFIVKSSWWHTILARCLQRRHSYNKFEIISMKQHDINCSCVDFLMGLWEDIQWRWIFFAFLWDFMNQCGIICLSVNSSENLSSILIKTKELQAIKVKAQVSIFFNISRNSAKKTFKSNI